MLALLGREARELGRAREIVLGVRLGGLILGLVLRAQQLLQVFDHREEELAQLVELGLGELGLGQRILVGLDRGLEGGEQLVGVAAQRFGRVELLLLLLELLLRGVELLGVGSLRIRRCAAPLRTCLLRFFVELLRLRGELVLLLGNQVLDPSHARAVRGEPLIGLAGAIGRRDLRAFRPEQLDELLLGREREIDGLLEVGEVFDRLRERHECVTFGLRRVIEPLGRERVACVIHLRDRLGHERQREPELGDLLGLLCGQPGGLGGRASTGRFIDAVDRRGEPRADLLDAVPKSTLALPERSGLQPARNQRLRLVRCGRLRCRAGAQLELRCFDGRDRAGLLNELELVLGDRLEHADRIEQLLARALERRECGLGLRDSLLGIEVLELATRLGDLRAALEHVEVEVLELDEACRILRISLVGGLLAGRVDLVGGQIADHAGLRDHAALLIGELREGGLLGERISPTGLLDREPRGPGLVEHAALLLDQGVQPRLELAFTARELVGQGLGAHACDREVRLRVRIARPLVRGIREPGHRLVLELERLGEVGILAGLELIGMRGVRHAEVVRRAVAELFVDATAAPRLEQRLLGLVVLGVRDRIDAFVVLRARVAMLAAITPRQDTGDEHGRYPHTLHADLRESPAPEPTHSEASRHSSAPSTSHG